MRRHRLSIPSALRNFLAVGVFLGLQATGALLASNPNPGIVPPHSRPHGMTYGEWGARWWQWVFSIPAASNPVLDSTGAYCGVGQSGGVWFLAGTFGGDATRNCTVPPGRMLFFPIVNVECSTLEGNGATEAALRACANGWINDNLAVATLSATIDGVPVQNLGSYRAESPLFTFTLPPGNVFEFFGIPAPAGTTSPAVADGIWLMLTPLPAGNHTVSFNIAGPIFSLAINYNLTVQ